MTRASRAFALACFAAAAIIAAPAAPAAQEVYRWVDANGVVHFTQTAPRGVPFERVSPTGPGARPADFYNPRRPGSRRAQDAGPISTQDSAQSSASTPAQALTPAQQQRQAELQAQAQARLSEMAETRRENCELARKQFEEFTTFARIRVSDGQGGVRILSEEERAERVAEAEEAIVLNCEDAG